MENFTSSESGGNGFHGPRPTADEWAALLAHTVAHLAAQLTMTQVRLRAIATELTARGGVDRGAIHERVREIASAETGIYLRENLGETIANLIDIESLEADIVDYLSSPDAR
jgi:hypothetical protein